MGKITIDFGDKNIDFEYSGVNLFQGDVKAIQYLFSQLPGKEYGVKNIYDLDIRHRLERFIRQNDYCKLYLPETGIDSEFYPEIVDMIVKYDKKYFFIFTYSHRFGDLLKKMTLDMKLVFVQDWDIKTHRIVLLNKLEGENVHNERYSGEADGDGSEYHIIEDQEAQKDNVE